MKKAINLGFLTILLLTVLFAVSCGDKNQKNINNPPIDATDPNPEDEEWF